MEKKAERRAKEAERLSKIARQSAEENMRKAQQAREMLEKSKRQSELTQMELVKNLNSQLEREADARIAAEKASKELQKQRDILKIAVEDAKSALDELKKRGAEDGGAEIARMQDLLAQREAEIERLKKRQAELERLRMEAEESQRKIAALQGRPARPAAFQASASLAERAVVKVGRFGVHGMPRLSGDVFHFRYSAGFRQTSGARMRAPANPKNCPQPFAAKRCPI